MNKKILKIIIAAICGIALLVAGIAIGGSFSGNYTSRDTKYYEEDFIDAENSYGDTYELKSTEESAELFNTGSDANQKLVYSGNVTIGTSNIKKSYGKVTDVMTKYDARFESVNETSYSKDMLIRVPKDKFIDFYEALSEVDGTITSSNVNIDDMTKRYSDNKRHIDILETEYKELKKLMERADKVDDILSIRDRMSELNYELETLQNTNNTIDYDAEYAKLNLSLRLSGTSSPVSFGHQIKEAFADSIAALKALFLFLVNIWWVIGAIAAGAVFYLKRKAGKEPSEAKEEEKETPTEEKEEPGDNE